MKGLLREGNYRRSVGSNGICSRKAPFLLTKVGLFLHFIIPSRACNGFVFAISVFIRHRWAMVTPQWLRFPPIWLLRFEKFSIWLRLVIFASDHTPSKRLRRPFG